MMEPKFGRAYLELTAAMVIVGSSVVVGKQVSSTFPTFLALLIRFMIGLPLLLFLIRRQGNFQLPSRSAMGAIFLQALTGVFLFNVLMLFGLRYITAMQSGLIYSTGPAVIAVLGLGLLRERLSGREWLGVVVSVAGIMLVSLLAPGDAEGQSSGAWFGILLAMGAVICEALFTIFRKMGADHVPPISNALLVTLFAWVLCLPVGLYQATQFDFSAVALSNYGILAYYGIFVTVIAYYFWFSGISKVPTGVAGVFTGIMPISTVVLSALLLHESFTRYHLLGLALVLAGIGCITAPPIRMVIRRPSLET